MFNYLIERKGNIFNETPFIFKINVELDAPSYDNSATQGTNLPILRVEAPAQPTVVCGDDLRIEKDSQIVFHNSSENEIQIALVTCKPVNNFIRCRMFKVTEENASDPSENLYSLTKTSVKVNIHDVKLVGKILTQKGFISKRIWPKFKALQTDRAQQ